MTAFPFMSTVEFRSGGVGEHLRRGYGIAVEEAHPLEPYRPEDLVGVLFGDVPRLRLIQLLKGYNTGAGGPEGRCQEIRPR